MKKVIILLVFLQATVLFAQKHDHNWIFGYGGKYSEDTISGSNFISFDGFEFNAHVPQPDSGLFNFAEYCVNYSDKEGDLLFYSNGIQIWDKDHKVMVGSEGFNAHPFHEYYRGFGLPMTQGGIVLPDPSDALRHYYVHIKMDYYYDDTNIQPYGINIHSSEIVKDVIGDSVYVGGLNTIIVADTFEANGLNAVKHANGRDWWIIMPRLKSNEYQFVLLSEAGVQASHTQVVGDSLQYGFQQAHFSSDGKKYVRHTALDNASERGAFIDVYDFNRCEGKLYNHIQLAYSDPAKAGGCAISPNSRFLYAHQGERLYQYDLESDDLETSAILIDEWDGYLYDDFFSTNFYNMQLAPDGKIYMTCVSGIKPMHVIHYPNKRGKACAFEQRGIFLPRSNTRSVPNHPNYRLGPIDDSLCDTLGIDNIPLAGWRHRDRYLEVEFTSVSDYEPSTWTWDFGDGTSSQDTCPIHYYMKEGTYEVCLTVSNIHGEDTYCKNITVKDSLSAIEVVENTHDMTLYPNPACDYASVYSKKDLGSVSIDIYDNQGRLVQRSLDELFSDKALRLDVSGLTAGIYMMDVKKRGIGIKKMKLVVVK